MDLSRADANKWAALLASTNLRPPVTEQEPGLVTAIRQVQRRLTDEEITQVAERYLAGATLKELAADLGCRRSTIGTRLAAAGITTRGRAAATEVQIDEIVRLYESGLSLAKVGEQVGLTAKTVLRYLRQRGVATRDTHGRTR